MHLEDTEGSLGCSEMVQPEVFRTNPNNKYMPYLLGPSSPRTSHSVTVANLLRRVHLVQHGVCLLFNKFLLH